MGEKEKSSIENGITLILRILLEMLYICFKLSDLKNHLIGKNEIMSFQVRLN